MKILDSKTVLITGGTGSFGKAFAQYLLEHTRVKKLVIFSRDEYKQSVMAEEFKDERVRFFIGDVREQNRLERAFEGVDVVIHAAALKQVPALEYNPYEAVKTNILGTQNVVEAALNKKVSQAILISTDKAVQPINLYGSTKLCAEKIFVAANAYGGAKTRFSVVRYGNVVGSRGSVVEKLLQSNSMHTVHITDERMTRFWIDLEQAAHLVLFALKNMEGGEIFIPRAPAMRVVDLFKLLAPKAKQRVIGIRPGEKIHEVLLTREEARHALILGDYFVILPEHGNMKRFARHKKKGATLSHDFHFASNENSELMTDASLLEIVRNLKSSLGS